MLALGLIMFGLVFGEGAVPKDCAYDREALMAKGVATFEETDHSGWRTLADKGCMHEAADLIAAWRKAHTDLPQDRMMGIAWHEGQMRAAFGDTTGAVTALALMLKHPDPAMRDYAAATIAFLKRDRPGLLAARAALAAETKPEGWDAAAADFKARYGQMPSWPDNLDKVDGLIACYDRPYKEAYGCGPKA